MHPKNMPVHIMHSGSTHHAFFALICIQVFPIMELEDIQRKIQFRQGSYTVTIPLQIVHALGIRKNQYVRFAISKNKIIIKPTESNITKKDLTDADRDSTVLDGEEPGYRGELAEALGKKEPENKSQLEKLRMK